MRLNHATKRFISAGDTARRRRFEVDAWLTNGAGDDLHGIAAIAIAAKIAQSAALHQPAMPAEEHFLGERFAEVR